MSEKFDSKYYENIICYNAFSNPLYMATIIDYIVPEYFDDENIRATMIKLKEFFNRTKKLPSKPELKACFENEEEAKKMNTLVELVRQNLTEKNEYDFDELCRKTEIFLQEKAVYFAIIKSTELMAKGQLDTNEVLDTFTEACNISLIDDTGFDYLRDIDKHLDNIKNSQALIPTDWKFIDKKLGGGVLANGRALYAFVGGTNVGKSIFLGNLAINFLKRDKNVLLITLEMPEDLYARRITCNITNIGFRSLLTRIDDLKTSLYTFRDKCKGKLIIKEFPTKGVTVNHINSYIKKLIKKGTKPDVLIVDYINLIKGTKNYNGTYDEIKDVAERLRATTYMFSIPCITATQLNRKGMSSENPNMDTTSESVGLPFTLDAQFSLWKSPEYENQIQLGIQKNRHGENFGQTSFSINYDTLTLTEIISDTKNSMTNDDVGSGDRFLTDLTSKVK